MYCAFATFSEIFAHAWMQKHHPFTFRVSSTPKYYHHKCLYSTTSVTDQKVLSDTAKAFATLHSVLHHSRTNVLHHSSTNVLHHSSTIVIRHRSVGYSLEVACVCSKFLRQLWGQSCCYCDCDNCVSVVHVIVVLVMMSWCWWWYHDVSVMMSSWLN